MSEINSTAVRDAVVEHFTRGRLDQGQKLLEQHGPQLPEAVRLECWGTLHFYRREMQEAVRSYETAIKLAPEQAIARYQYLVGVQEEREGNFVEAFKRFQAAIEIDRGFVDAYVDLGGLLMKVRDFEGAATCYRDAVKLEPSEAANHRNLVTALTQLAQKDATQHDAELQAAEASYKKAFNA